MFRELFLQWLTKNGNLVMRIKVDTEQIMNEIDVKLREQQKPDSMTDGVG